MEKVSIYIKENKNSLFNSILFLIFGIILFTNPGEILNFLSYIAGTIFLILGIFNILSYYKTLKKLNIEQTNKLVSAIILIIIAISVVIFSSFIETTIRLISSGWIIYSGIIKLIEAFKNKNNKITFYIELSVSILMILCGFYVALAVNLVFSLIGLFIIIYSILDIVSYVNNNRK